MCMYNGWPTLVFCHVEEKWEDNLALLRVKVMRIGSNFKRLMHGNSCSNKCTEHHFQLSLIRTILRKDYEAPSWLTNLVSRVYITVPIFWYAWVVVHYGCKVWSTLLMKYMKRRNLTVWTEFFHVLFSPSTPNICRWPLSCGFHFWNWGQYMCKIQLCTNRHTLRSGEQQYSLLHTWFHPAVSKYINESSNSKVVFENYQIDI